MPRLGLRAGEGDLVELFHVTKRDHRPIILAFPGVDTVKEFVWLGVLLHVDAVEINLGPVGDQVLVFLHVLQF